MKKIIKYVIVDILRNKIVLFYTFLSLIISLSIFNLESTTGKGLLTLLYIVLIIVPLVCLVFSTIYIYNSAEFIELLVSQPLRRRTIWTSLFIGLSFSLSVAFLIGIGLPILIYQPNSTGIMMLLMGFLLSIIFVSIAMLASAITRDKAKGIGFAILLWLYFSLIFDALVLFILFQFQDYPLEKPMIIFSFLNPIDLSRIQILLKMDVSALMGYTGAVFKDFFGTASGIAVSTIVMFLWILIPVWISSTKFAKKDL
jgi:Cu-processing system permease protein